MGDSITRFWGLPATNLGIPGNTTTQMLARFPQQVLGHGYKAVVILGGSTEIRDRNLSASILISQIVNNIEVMAADAEGEKQVVVLCTLPPISGNNDRVEPLNVAITSLANAHKYKLVNYYTPMSGHPEYFKDGIHPNDEGYSVMDEALSKVLPLNY